MRRPHLKPANRQSQYRQFDLFGPPRRSDDQQGPSWNNLPAETRREVTCLMMRLILDYGRADCRQVRGETTDDA